MPDNRDNQDALREIQREGLRRDIQRGLDAVAAGRFVEYDRTTIGQIADKVKAEGRQRQAQA